MYCIHCMQYCYCIENEVDVEYCCKCRILKQIPIVCCVCESRVVNRAKAMSQIRELQNFLPVEVKP